MHCPNEKQARLSSTKKSRLPLPKFKYPDTQPSTLRNKQDKTMVEFEEIPDSKNAPPPEAPAAAGAADEEDLLPSQDRLLDAEAIEKAADTIDRPTARIHLTSLAKKLRREAEALKRLEKTRHLSPSKPARKAGGSAADGGDDDDELEKESNSDDHEHESDAGTRPVPKTEPVPLPRPAPGVAQAVAPPPGVKYIPVDRFAFDAGGYNSQFVTLYVPFPGVGGIDREKITCDFASASFDLIVRDLNGKSYRLFKDNLGKSNRRAAPVMVANAY